MKNETWEMPFKWKENMLLSFFYSECGHTLEQVAQRGCGISSLAAVLIPSRHISNVL